MSHKKEDSSPTSQARKAFRSGATRRPMTEYEKEQKALQKNLERLKAERLARETAKSKDS
jgi:hypothetical protein